MSKTARTVPAVVAGQRWQDRDPRMSHRIVIIESADQDGFVEYRTCCRSSVGPICRSRYLRFQRAFELVAPSKD